MSSKINWFMKSKDDCITELTKRNLLTQETGIKGRDELAKILSDNDLIRTEEDTINKMNIENSNGWEEESLALSPNVIEMGYNGKSGNIKLVINSIKKQATVEFEPGAIFVNDKKWNEGRYLKGLNSIAVRSFVYAGVVVLTKAQKDKFNETFFK